MSDPPGAVAMEGASVPTIVNGLLCCTMRALSRADSRGEFASVIDRELSENEIKEAWTILFSFYSEVEDKNQKKKIIDIARQTTLKLVEDIIMQLDSVSNNGAELTELSLLMPWNYVIREFETDSEYRAKIWEQKKAKEIDPKLVDLERRMEKKHADLVAHLDRWSTSIAYLVNNRQVIVNHPSMPIVNPPSPPSVNPPATSIVN